MRAFKIPCFEGVGLGPERKLRKLECTYWHGTVFAPMKYLYQKEATGMDRPQMYSASRCKNPTYLCRPSKYPVSREALWAQNGKLRKLGQTYRHDTVFALRKYLSQKESTSMERPEMYSTSRCNNPTYLCGPSKHPNLDGGGMGPEWKVA